MERPLPAHNSDRPFIFDDSITRAEEWNEELAFAIKGSSHLRHWSVLILFNLPGRSALFLHLLFATTLNSVKRKYLCYI